ncbi:MAG: hypothetical protein J6X43_08715 [Bacteroidales bacterium]|nr:hypothetical protein [Bacteroidales bacterium]
MKLLRTLLIGTITIGTSLLTTSCNKEYITEEYITKEYYGSKVYTCEYSIKRNDWQVGTYDDGRKYLYATCENPDITDNVMNNGAVLAYYWFTYNAETNSCSWNLLPYVFPYLYTDKESGETRVVGENFRFEYEKGVITFVVEDLDSWQPDDMGDETIFKAVVIEN